MESQTKTEIIVPPPSPPPPPPRSKPNYFKIDFLLRLLTFVATLVGIIVELNGKQTEVIGITLTGIPVRRSAKYNDTSAFMYGILFKSYKLLLEGVLKSLIPHCHKYYVQIFVDGTRGDLLLHHHHPLRVDSQHQETITGDHCFVSPGHLRRADGWTYGNGSRSEWRGCLYRSVWEF